jgi:hypothetical protein
MARHTPVVTSRGETVIADDASAALCLTAS